MTREMESGTELRREQGRHRRKPDRNKMVGTFGGDRPGGRGVYTRNARWTDDDGA